MHRVPLPLVSGAPSSGCQTYDLTGVDGLHRIVICAYSMYNFARLNRQKREWCVQEGIRLELATEDERNTLEFKDMGDASSLYRYGCITIG